MADPLESEPQAPGPPKGALGTIFMIVFVDLLGFGIIIPRLPRCVPQFTEHPVKVTLLFSVFSVFQFVGAPVLGLLSDRYGRPAGLVGSPFGSAAGYLLLGFATKFDPKTALLLVYLSRIIDGFTGGNIS